MPSAIRIKLPELFGGREARELGVELKDKLTAAANPSVLVDLSQVKEMDLDGVEGLLDCMEIIADYDGALELGEISAEAAILLELTRMDRLFRKFPGFDRAAGFTAASAATGENEDAAVRKIQAQPVAA